MKLRLEVSEEKYTEIKEKMLELGFELDDEADFVLTERNHYLEYVSCKKNEEACHLPMDEIVYFESMGHDIILHTLKEKYRCSDRLWQLEKSLNPLCFLRISNSVIINRKKKIKIKAALSQKFLVTMIDESVVDVTRSYYYIFKNEFGI